MMVLDWMRVGFVHGVMNTDNMSIHGPDTIDYGPYGWLEGYDPGWTPNTTDAAHRRYRYGQQPQVAHWNLAQLANALVTLIGRRDRAARGTCPASASATRLGPAGGGHVAGQVLGLDGCRTAPQAADADRRDLFDPADRRPRPT